MGLPWVRLDTNINTHDKVLTLLDGGSKGKQAGFVYCMSIAYAAGHGTDGVIKRAALPFIHGTQADAKLLVMAELWECVEGGYRIKNWGNRNVVGATQQVLSDIRSEAGKKGAQARWDN
ncbi:hypothetical protein GCM10007304_18070 [Rhodococcoides trifolii]|uniref:Uncharacterized protein n=1 Tax=Rhodococcoides trifolii TaxID=908250 RepID=A0A917FTS0_9NOCA|nr:hypothetical protein [Rhodococcus trifolii]GGG04345.1 hypothetical protein GCM10007304_18070 [Rhodococcus trifolii]